MSVTYREGSQTRNGPVLTGLGAYLIGQRYTSGRPLGSVSETDGRDEPGNYSSPAGPNGALTAITYSYAGRSCVDRGNLRLASCGLSEVPPAHPAALPIVRESLRAYLHVHNHVITSAQISFNAPYPVTNADEDYSVTAPVCRQVNITVPLETSCATSYSGRVFYATSSGIGGESGDEGPLYEVIAAQFGAPGSGRNPMNFPTVGSFNISVP